MQLLSDSSTLFDQGGSDNFGHEFANRRQMYLCTKTSDSLGAGGYILELASSQMHCAFELLVIFLCFQVSFTTAS